MENQKVREPELDHRQNTDKTQTEHRQRAGSFKRPTGVNKHYDDTKRSLRIDDDPSDSADVNDSDELHGNSLQTVVSNDNCREQIRRR